MRDSMDDNRMYKNFLDRLNLGYSPLKEGGFHTIIQVVLERKIL